MRVSFHTPHAREAVTAGVTTRARGGNSRRRSRITDCAGRHPAHRRAHALAGFALAIDMLVAGLTAYAGNGFFADKGGCELMLGSASVTVLIASAGASMPQNGRPVVRHKLYPARMVRPH